MVMDLAEGGKIDTELYSSACGALSSRAQAGDTPASRHDPIPDMARPQSTGAHHGLPGRARLCVGSIRSVRWLKNPANNYRSILRVPRPIVALPHDTVGNMKCTGEPDPSSFPTFEAPYAPDDGAMAARLL